jgi:hypothetical protein
MCVFQPTILQILILGRPIAKSHHTTYIALVTDVFTDSKERTVNFMK